MYYYALNRHVFIYICINMCDSERIIAGKADMNCTGLNTNMPVRLEKGGAFLCRGGYGDIVIDLKQYRITKGDIVVAFPYSVVQVISYSDDFDGSVIAADVNFFGTLQISDKSFHYLYIRDNPCISLMEEEWDKVVSLHDMLLRESIDAEHPLRREIDECIMKMIIYEVAAIYLKRKPITQQIRSRNDIIFQQFIFSLFNNFHVHRTVDFYATEQSITPRHLSVIVKQMSGRTAGEWIICCTIMNIKTKLQDPKLTIKEISAEMNFPNPSFFSQYFKKYVGITPKEYRKGEYL